MQDPYTGCFLFPQIHPFLSIRIEFFLLHSALPHYIWASVSSRPTGSNILSLRQAKHLLAFLLYFKCIRDKGDICEENLFLFIFTPVISYSRASEGCTDTVWLRVSASNLKQLLACRFFFFTDSSTYINRLPSSQLESMHSTHQNVISRSSLVR